MFPSNYSKTMIYSWNKFQLCLKCNIKMNSFRKINLKVWCLRNSCIIYEIKIRTATQIIFCRIFHKKFAFLMLSVPCFYWVSTKSHLISGCLSCELHSSGLLEPWKFFTQKYSSNRNNVLLAYKQCLFYL